jgi:hypothetical protein
MPTVDEDHDDGAIQCGLARCADGCNSGLDM